MGVAFSSELQADLVARRRAIKARLFPLQAPAPRLKIVASLLPPPEPEPIPESTDEAAAKEVERQRIEEHLRQNYPDFLAWRASREGRANFAKILAAVIAEFNVTECDIKSIRRTADIVLPRQVAMYLAKHMLEASLPAIGRWLGDRDHATVLHGHKKIASLLLTDHDLAERVAKIKRKILGEPEPPDENQLDLPFDWRLRCP